MSVSTPMAPEEIATPARILVVGGGGRENALAWALARCPGVEQVWVAPGNGGTPELSGCQQLAIDEHDQDRLLTSLFTPARLLEFLRSYVLFDRKVGKIVARYQQFFGIRALLARIRQVRPDGGREGGVVWPLRGRPRSGAAAPRRGPSLARPHPCVVGRARQAWFGADIKTLTSEKARTSQEVEDGASSIIPIGAVAHLFGGSESQSIEIGTGEYNKKLDAKISEIKQQCNIM